MKKFKIASQKFPLLVLTAIFLAVSFFGFWIWWFNGLRPAGLGSQEKTNFVIRRGEAVSAVAARLKEKNLINDAFHFKLYLFYTGLARKIQAGSYQLSPGMSPAEIAKILIKGTNDQWVTIIEGLREEQIGEFLIKSGFAINPEEWQKEIAADKLEGRLFPDSYLFPKGATQGAILRIIDRNFKKKVEEGLNGEIKASGLSLNELLTLASIVERESRNDEDRRIVAGIILKRWQGRWPLQADATIQYAVATGKCRQAYDAGCDWWPKSLTEKDLKVKSRYNSYLYQGLPPGPICNPGLASIKAVLNPQESPYWYYLSDKDGLMHYAKTDEEQVRNIQKYLIN